MREYSTVGETVKLKEKTKTVIAYDHYFTPWCQLHHGVQFDPSMEISPLNISQIRKYFSMPDWLVI